MPVALPEQGHIQFFRRAQTDQIRFSAQLRLQAEAQEPFTHRRRIQKTQEVLAALAAADQLLIAALNQAEMEIPHQLAHLKAAPEDQALLAELMPPLAVVAVHLP